MRTRLLIPLIVVIVALLAAAGVLYQKLQRSTAEFAALQAEEEAARERYGQAIGEIAAIQDSLNAIVLGEEGAQALATQLESERSLSRTRGDEAMARIAAIRAGLQRAKDRIQELDAKLQESGDRLTGMERMIQNLRQSVAEKEELIAQLTERVQTLQTRVAGLEAEVEEGQHTILAQEETIVAQDEAIENSRRELRTVYYTIGTKKELSASGMVASKGGILGLGRTLIATGVIDPSLFTPLDTGSERVIQIPAGKARVLSDQPPASYELHSPGGEGGGTELRILDPQAFCRVKHVIIVTS